MRYCHKMTLQGVLRPHISWPKTMKIGFVQYNHICSPKQKSSQGNTKVRTGGRKNPECEQYFTLWLEAGELRMVSENRMNSHRQETHSCSPVEQDCTRILHDSEGIFIFKSFRKIKPNKINPNQTKAHLLLPSET